MGARRVVAVLIAVSGLSAACGGADAEAPSVPVAPPASTASAKEHPSAAASRLFLAGDGQLTVVDVESQRARVVDFPLAAGDPPFRIVRRGRSLVFYGGDTYTVDLEIASRPRKLHTSWFFIPAASEDRVWVALLDPAGPETERRLSAVAEVTTDGVVTSPPVRPPEGRWPVAAVTAGLLFEREGDGLDLWDPVRHTMIRSLPKAWRGPTHGNLLAWSDGNGRRWGGSLTLTDAAAGTELWRIRPPAGFAIFLGWAGEFAPDGRTLAVPVARSRSDLARHALALVDAQSGRVTVVPGSEVPAGYVFVAWTSSGQEVFLTGGQYDQPRTIVAFRLGEEHARKLAVEVRDFYGIAAS